MLQLQHNVAIAQTKKRGVWLGCEFTMFWKFLCKCYVINKSIKWRKTENNSKVCYLSLTIDIFYIFHLILLDYLKILQEVSVKRLRQNIIKEFQFNIFFSVWVFFHEHSRFTRTAGEGGEYLFNSWLPFPPASQTLRN